MGDIAMNRFPLHVLAASAAAVVLLGACVQQVGIRDTANIPVGASADDLLIVDCLLPGQVRRLGTQMTYLSARRPVQTTAQDCAIRGGEYVAYDRANYQFALNLWMPLALQGDADAQNKVGEIHERGLGVRPNFEEAARWYRLAAEQGFERAQINLAFLLEKGLGVTRDRTAALHWYRRASRLPDAVLIDQADLAAQLALIDSLRGELDTSRGELDRARRDLQQIEQRLQTEREGFRRRLEAAPPGGMSEAERQRLEADRRALATQSAELARRQQQIAELEQVARRQNERLLLMETEGASLREQLALVRSQEQRAQQDLAHYQQLAQENERILHSTRADMAAVRSTQDSMALAQIRQLEQQLAAHEQVLATERQRTTQLEDQTRDLASRLERSDRANTTEITALNAALHSRQQELEQVRAAAHQRTSELDRMRQEIATRRAGDEIAAARLLDLEAQLRERETALAQQKDMVVRLQVESEQWREKLTQLEELQVAQANTPNPATENVPLAPPNIQLLDPPLPATRSATEEIQVSISRELRSRPVIGQVTAPAGLYALTVNGVRAQADVRGLFEQDIPVAGAETPVHIAAIDADGRRSAISFRLVPEASAPTTVVHTRNPLAGVTVGHYHALVIGNQRYAHLQNLETAEQDAREVARVLRDHFGFDVTLLMDANRYQILSELNRLRMELTDQDNLLVYYAGHGELDRVNLRGHWLPIDAEMHSTANWISNVAITDVLNAMSVRQVLIVADSCYSGALTRSALGRLDAGQSPEARNHWLQTIVQMRSRTALTSGGLAPVLDGGGGNHSVFAKAFLDVLAGMSEITEGQRVFMEVSARVAYNANRYQIEQVPEYAPIKFSGHESGDFVFIPRNIRELGRNDDFDAPAAVPLIASTDVRAAFQPDGWRTPYPRPGTAAGSSASGAH